MAKTRAQKKRKIGRNDPCWCGSGRKYKECHLSIEQEERDDQRKLREAQDLLMSRIIEAAQTKPECFPEAMEMYWKGQYTPDQMMELDDLEHAGADRFLTWFAFDYPLEDGRTLVEQLAAAAERGEFEADEHEQRLLRAWQGVRMRPYVVEDVFKGKGLLVRDLLDDVGYEVKDQGAGKRMKEEEILVGHLVPVDRKHAGKPPTMSDGDGAGDKPDNSTEEDVTLYYIAGSVGHLTADTREKLIEFAGLYLADMQRTQPDATWNDLLRERSHVLNHFVMALPVEEYDPTIMDDILLEARVMLQMTKQSVEGMMNRDDDEDDEDDKDDER